MDHLWPFDQALDRIGGVSTLDSAASRRALDSFSEVDQERADRAARVDMLRVEFLRAAGECQADKFAMFAPRVRNWKQGGTRMQTVGEVLHGALDTPQDFAERAMQVLLNAVAGRGTQREAQQLLGEIAAKWADDEVDSL